MKKILISIFLLVLLTGCSSKKEGKILKIELYENSSTGYNWTKEINKPDIIEIKESSDYSNCPDDVVGCGGKRIYEIKGLKEGKVILTLNYSFLGRMENDVETAVYEITVDKNLNITETHSGNYFSK